MKNFPSTCPSFCAVDTVAAVLGLHFVTVGQSSRAPFIVYQHRYRSSSLVLRYPLFVKTSVCACLPSPSPAVCIQYSFPRLFFLIMEEGVGVKCFVCRAIGSDQAMEVVMNDGQ